MPKISQEIKDKIYDLYHNHNYKIKQIQEELKVSKTTIYRYIKIDSASSSSNNSTSSSNNSNRTSSSLTNQL